MNKFFLYALFVTVVATGTSWVKLFASVAGTGGSSWSSRSGGYGGGYGGGYSGGGGGHK
jgi:acidic type I keratin